MSNVPTPPDYVVKLLGPPPAAEMARRKWDAARAAVESYRRRWGITHPSSALGSATSGLIQAADREATVAAVRTYQRALQAHAQRHVLDDNKSRSAPEVSQPLRLPLEPLLNSLRLDGDQPTGSHQPGRLAQAALILGISKRTLQRYWHSGVDPWTADSLAIAAGLHPRIVWGDAWDQAAGAMERQRQAEPMRQLGDGRHL